jgi:pteridine reductase
MPGESKVALVTGGAQRIGAEIFRQLHAAGYRIALHYRTSEAAAAELADQLNILRTDSCCGYSADLLEQQYCVDLAARVMADFQRVDLLVNNAAAFFQTPVESCAETDWNLLLDTNLKVPFFLSQALITTLREHGGSIVNIVDAYTDKPQRNYAAYTISKNGLAMLTRSLALELAPGVRVNGVSPGAILWPQQPDGQMSETEQQAMLARIPMQRLGESQDIAAAVVFLADAPYITGQVLCIDGGVSLRG